MRVAYVDMVGGVSGDMLLGALIDAGLPLSDLKGELAKLPVGGFALGAEKVKRGGVSSTLVSVDLDEAGGRTRDWASFEAAVRTSSLPASDKEQSAKVLDLLARAESAVHGVTPANVHLHELGTVDTLVDVVGVIAGLRLLGVTRVHASPFPLSSGTSRSSHGPMAATAAATGEIYRITGVPVRAGGQHGPSGEAVTPTGAALLATVASFDAVSITPQRTGYGAGRRDPEDYPNVTGIWIGTMPTPSRGAAVVPDDGLKMETGLWLLETNIDDMTGEALAYAQQRAMEAGALDAWITPVQMKKGRPAVVFSVLVTEASERAVAARMLEETSTLGVRRRPTERYVADREVISVTTRFGQVRVKIKRIGGRVLGVHPEFEDCRSIAVRDSVPLHEVADAAGAAARKSLGLP